MLFEDFSDSFAAVRCIGKASVISHGVHKAWKEIAEFGAAGRA